MQGTRHTAPAPPTAGPSKGYSDGSIPPEDAYVSLDCEFVGIMSGAEHALAQVSVCDFHGSVVYSSYCRSDAPVVDYRSWVSGVRPADLVNAPSFALVQDRVKEAIKGKILVGHALHNDLAVLAIDHPQHMIRDTAFYRPLQRLVHSDRPSLRALAKAVLNKEVQTGEHGATTDAQVTMDIFKVHRQAWEATLLAGIDPLAGALSTSPPNGFHSISPTFPLPQTSFSPQGHVPPTPFANMPFQSLPSPFSGQFMQPPPPPDLGTPFQANGLSDGMRSPEDSRFSAAFTALPPPTAGPAQSQPPQNLAALETLQRLQQQKRQTRSPSTSTPFAPTSGTGWRPPHQRSQSTDMSMSPSSNYTRTRHTSGVSSHSSGSPVSSRQRTNGYDSKRVDSQNASPKKPLKNGKVLGDFQQQQQQQRRDPSPNSMASGSQMSDNNSSSSEGDPLFNPLSVPTVNAGKARPFVVNGTHNGNNAVQDGGSSPKERGSRGARRLRIPLRDADTAIVPAAA